jgi:hypothetical protein
MTTTDSSKDGSILLKFLGREIPSFKNTKMIARGRLITDPKKQAVMEQITTAFEFQLHCAIPRIATKTLTEQQRLSLIASYLPLDDSRKWISELCVRWLQVPKGKEGALVRIERV